MKQVFSLLCLSLFSFCHSANVNVPVSETISTQAVTDVAADINPSNAWQNMADETDSTYFTINDQFPWMGDTIRSYIQLSTDEMVKFFVKDSSVMFMYDGIENGDTSSNVSVRIGADVNNGEGVIFSTAKLIYIDTRSRQIYEYDFETDSSYLWVRPPVEDN